MITSTITFIIWRSGLMPVAFFFVYSTGLFFISYEWLPYAALFNFLLVVFLRKSPRLVLKNLLLFLPFIGILLLFSFPTLTWQSALILTARFLLAANFTYVYGTAIGALRFAKGIEILLSPLRLVRVKTRNISLIVAVAMTFIPVILREITATREGMNAKGQRKAKWSMLFSLVSYKILYRASVLSDTLNAKGHQ